MKYYQCKSASQSKIEKGKIKVKCFADLFLGFTLMPFLVLQDGFVEQYVKQVIATRTKPTAHLLVSILLTSYNLTVLLWPLILQMLNISQKGNLSNL